MPKTRRADPTDRLGTVLQRLAARVAWLALLGVAPQATRGEHAPPPLLEGGYELVWADEFDAEGPPSPDNWTFEQGFVRNREAQWYQPQNAFCESGLLVIEARRERVEVDAGAPHTPNWARARTHADYTSASLRTSGRHEWLYGRFVMRARIPTAQGAWPAFWTVGRGRWPASGEIDVMEYYQGDLLANVAWMGASRRPKWDAVRTPISELGDASWVDHFHVWRMDWDADSIRLYVDGRLLNETELQTTINDNEAADNPFHHPHHVLVNLAIGGVHGGDPSRSAFPMRYEIDYIRVYQRATDDGGANAPLATAAPER